jgi:hypothetical protein
MGKSFQDILEDKLAEVNSGYQDTGTQYSGYQAAVEPAGLAFLLGQIGKVDVKVRPARPYPRPKTSAKKTAAPKLAPPPPPPRPAHILSEAQQKSFAYFESASFALPKNFSIDDLKFAFRKLALKFHPDSGGHAAQFIELKRHFETLKKIFQQNL